MRRERRAIECTRLTRARARERERERERDLGVSDGFEERRIGFNV